VKARLLAVAALALALSSALSGCGGAGTGVTAAPLQTSLARAFARLYVLQQAEEGNPRPPLSSLDSRASCQKGGNLDLPQDGSGVWLCQVTYLVAGPQYPVTAKYEVDVQTDGCYAAGGDGPASVNGSPTITGPRYAQLVNPLALIDGCFDITT
jgi:ABC-2 type transport system permease protein